MPRCRHAESRPWIVALHCYTVCPWRWGISLSKYFPYLLSMLCDNNSGCRGRFHLDNFSTTCSAECIYDPSDVSDTSEAWNIMQTLVEIPSILLCNSFQSQGVLTQTNGGIKSNGSLSTHLKRIENRVSQCCLEAIRFTFLLQWSLLFMLRICILGVPQDTIIIEFPVISFYLQRNKEHKRKEGRKNIYFPLPETICCCTVKRSNQLTWCFFFFLVLVFWFSSPFDFINSYSVFFTGWSCSTL